VERVKAILARKSLTLYQVSQKTRVLYGRLSPYFIPHNLYYDLGLGTYSPSLHQLFALSSISDYRFNDWLRVFGFHPDDIAALYDAVDFNEPGETVFLPLMLARLDDGRIFIESQRDIYRRGTGGIDAVRTLAEAIRISNSIDWTKAEAVVNEMDGIARDVSITPIATVSTVAGVAK